MSSCLFIMDVGQKTTQFHWHHYLVLRPTDARTEIPPACNGSKMLIAQGLWQSYSTQPVMQHDNIILIIIRQWYNNDEHCLPSRTGSKMSFKQETIKLVSCSAFWSAISGSNLVNVALHISFKFIKIAQQNMIHSE